ncbi:MAG: MFS transporter [Chloroflexales bacterium]|nr:MFS transporter [Chloroflexales bacterium]
MHPAPHKPIFRHRLPFFSLIAADAISLNGNMLAQLAIPWYVLETTGSATQTGITAFFGLLPLTLAGLLGGPLIDRLGHKCTSVVADVASGICVALIPLLHTTIGLAFWQLLALVFLGALLDAPGTTARAALLPDVAHQADISLERANSIHEVIESGAQLSGPLLAGLLIAWIGPSNVFWLNAASFAISALLVASSIPITPVDQEDTLAHGYWRELIDGLRFVIRDPVIRSIFVSGTILNFLISPLLAVILPVYMNTVYHSAISLGAVIAAFGGGSVAGAIVYGVIGHTLPRRRTFVVGVLAIGGAFATLTVLPPVALMVAAFLIAGLISGPNGPLVSTLLQERTPLLLRGRVFGVTTAVGFAAAPLGVLVAGYLLDAIGIQTTLIGMTVIFLLVTAGLALDPGLQEMDRLAPAPASTPDSLV